MANRISTPFVVDQKPDQEKEQRQPAARVAVPAKELEDQVVLLDEHRRTMDKKAHLKGRTVDRPANQIGEQIGKELRVLYEELVTQPIPERFLDLLNQLEKATISVKGDKKAPEGK